MAKLQLFPPIVSYTNAIRELFKRDPEITMQWSDETATLTMLVDNPEKASALTNYLPDIKKIGRQEVKINIIPSNGLAGAPVTEIDKVFAGNPIYNFSKKFPIDAFGNPIHYVVFNKEVIQYYENDLGDIYGMRSVLAEDLAREVLENTEGIYFCTDKDMKFKDDLDF